MGDAPSPPASGEGTTPLDGATSAQLLVRRFRIAVTEGPDRGASFTSTGERTVIGTHENADFRLTDPTVSRFHCEIALADGRALLRDLGSRNGTTVAGVAVQAAPLSGSVNLALGRTQLSFDLGADVVKLAVSSRSSFGAMVGASPAMRRLYALLERAAASDATVLLEGATGTGKEAAADSIHRESARGAAPFLVVDCGAVPANLLESELFGHERGAFTGAVAPREGVFEAADGGTIFLDEIGELSPDLQPKLLRVLERREVKRLGGNQYRPVDVRVIAATNRNLRAEVNAHRFRADLYFRLAVIEARLPSLSEHPEDIPALVEHILERRGALEHPTVNALRAPDFRAELARHTWPGNVRELRNYVERCLALHERAPILAAVAEASPVPVDTRRPLRDVRNDLVADVERRYLQAIVAEHGGNVSAAARAAGIDRIHFYRLLSRHGLRPR